MTLFVYTLQSLDKMGSSQASASMLMCFWYDPSLIRSYIRFERGCNVHKYSTSPNKAGIGFPRQQEHSYFSFAS